MRKEAVVLLNMGGPNNLEEVELFLKNMFSDPNILTMKSSLLRRFVGGIITLLRAEQAQEIYRELGGKSPIVGHTKQLVDALAQKLGDDVIVDFAMRYTPPFADEVVERLKAENIEHVYLIPLYPQYSTTTTKSSLEDFERAMHEHGLDAVTYEVKHFFENEHYNACILSRIKESLGDANPAEYELIFSAHGLPQKIVDKGDPYQRHVERHVDILKGMLADEGLNFSDVRLAYQSKVGPMQWLEPSLEQSIKKVRWGQGLMIFPIAFTIDNSETVFELGVEYKEFVDEMGLENYKVCLCPNEHPLFIEALSEIYHKMK